MEKKDVFFIEFKGLSSFYGVGSYSRILLKTLSKNEPGFDMNLVIIGFGNEDRFERIIDDKIGYDVINIFFKVDNPNYFDSFDFTIDHNKAKFCASVIASQVKGKRTPIIHVNSILHFGLLPFFKEMGFKIIYTQHSPIWRMITNNDLRKFVRDFDKGVRHIHVVKEIELCNMSDKIICLNSESEDILTTFYKISPDKVQLIYNGINLEADEDIDKKLLRKNYGFNESDIIISFVGRLHKDKGVFELINAFDKLLKLGHNDIRLIIAGSGQIDQVIKASQSSFARISIVGYAESPFKNEIYKLTDIGVLPSYHEQSSFTILEMLKNKLPSIVTDTVGFEAFEHGRHLLKVKMKGNYTECPRIDDNDFFNKLKSLITNVGLRNGLSQNGYQIILNQCSSDVMATKTGGVYNSI